MTYDRLLLRNFLYVFVACFLSLFGLLVIIDLLENLDEFLAANKTSGGGTAGLLGSIAQCYAYKSIFFLDQAGPTLTIITVMVVLILLQKSGELHPLLAAGIPMYRVLLPLVLASVGVGLILALNQEFVVPRIAHAAYESRGVDDPSKHQVEAITDHSSRITIDGDTIVLAERTIKQAAFLLPPPTLASEVVVMEAPTATYYPAKGKLPAGWLLRDVSPSPQELEQRLTDAGRKIIRTKPNSDDVFVASPVTCDQLYRRSSSFSWLSTRELMERIRCTAYGTISLHRLVLHFHQRLAQPLINLIAVLITIPLMVRRESPGIVADSALCGFVLAMQFGVIQGCQALGMMHVLTPDLAAWIPVVVGGTIAAWLSGVIRT